MWVYVGTLRGSDFHPQCLYLCCQETWVRVRVRHFLKQGTSVRRGYYIYIYIKNKTETCHNHMTHMIHHDPMIHSTIHAHCHCIFTFKIQNNCQLFKNQKLKIKS